MRGKTKVLKGLPQRNNNKEAEVEVSIQYPRYDHTAPSKQIYVMHAGLVQVQVKS